MGVARALPLLGTAAGSKGAGKLVRLVSLDLVVRAPAPPGSHFMDASSTAVLQSMSFLDGAILVLYLVGLAAIALYHSRKMHSQEITSWPAVP